MKQSSLSFLPLTQRASETSNSGLFSVAWLYIVLLYVSLYLFTLPYVRNTLFSCLHISNSNLLQNHIRWPASSRTLLWMLMTGCNKHISLLTEHPLNIPVTTHIPYYEQYCLCVTFVFMCLSLPFTGTILESSITFLFIFGFQGLGIVSVRRLEPSRYVCWALYREHSWAVSFCLYKLQICCL